MDLDQIRQEIDEVDGKLRDLFLQRMDLSRQVIEHKKKTGGAVYAPKREQAVLSARTSGVSEEYGLPCKAFFRQVMGISRTYQYSEIAEDAACLRGLPEKEGEVLILFSCKRESASLAACLNAAALAGLVTERVNAEGAGGTISCGLRLSGDFSSRQAKAAVLQILEENEDAKMMPAF